MGRLVRIVLGCCPFLRLRMLLFLSRVRLRWCSLLGGRRSIFRLAGVRRLLQIRVCLVERRLFLGLFRLLVCSICIFFRCLSMGRCRVLRGGRLLGF